MKTSIYKSNKIIKTTQLGFLICLLFFISCTNIGNKKEYPNHKKIPEINCPIVIGPRSAQLMVSFNSAYNLFDKRVMFVSIKKADAPATGRDAMGNVYETIKCSKPDSMIMVVKADDKYISVGQNSVLMCKGLGEYASWFGKTISKFYYKDTNDSIIQIGEQEMKYRDTPSGGKVLLTKGLADTTWFGNAYGSVYRGVSEDSIEQIGVFDFFQIAINDSTFLPRSIVMTRGINPNDKWCGELDGVLYIQK